jgi:GT2 family glycosyltransferase
VGGFEEALPRAFNDVDLCLRLKDKGYLIVYTPFAELYHYESASRPLTVDSDEASFMHERWGNLLQNDPYYNPNLTLEREDFSLRVSE